jgi:iron(III) transport system ATP-binding protein
MSADRNGGARAAVGVDIERVEFGYGEASILADVSLSVGGGEFFAFLGPSGSGKTTLLRLVAGFGRPRRGRILIGGRNMSAAPPWKRNIGMVFQSYALWPHMTVAENVAFGLEQRRLPRAEIRRRVAAALDLVGLGDLAPRRPAQLSGGQQQRVALARTIVVEPDVLLLDEPLSNLDAKLRVEMREELRALQRRLGLTTIYVTHDQEEANAVADRMAVLDGGRIQQVGAPAELYDRPANRFVATFLGESNLVDGAVGADGRFRAGAGTLILDLAPGAAAGPATASIRPQALALARRDAGTGPEAEIVGRTFLGAATRYALTAGGVSLTAVAPHLGGAPEHAIGDRVRLAVDPARVTLLPAA